MIDLSQKLLLSLLLNSFICGALLGLVYEAIRFIKLFCRIDHEQTLRKQIMLSVNKVIEYVLTFFMDISFCLLFAVCAITLTYKMSGGVFRGIVYTAMLLGLFAYYFTLGRLFLKLNKKIIHFIKKIIGKLVALIKIPLKVLFSLFVKLYHLTIGRLIGKIINRIREKRKMREIKRKAAEKRISETAEEKEEKYEQKIYGYRKENRVSFNGSRAT